MMQSRYQTSVTTHGVVANWEVPPTMHQRAGL